MSGVASRVGTLLALAALFSTSRTRASEVSPPATFAFIVGVNASVDGDLKPLRYADDDAARTLDLFHALGAHTYLLSTLDENTRRLHPKAAAEAQPPTHAGFTRAVETLAADVNRARAAGRATAVYFIYAGHGNVRNGQGYITLEDSRLRGHDLASDFVDRVHADRTHLVIDACDSYFLAFSRGPGGARRSIDEFADTATLGNDPTIGLLLSTSTARESHEWEEYQAGVFSHEVRSGLYGAADANADGIIDYAEIGAFIKRANGAILNERYRPEVFARAPKATTTLLDIRAALGRRVEVKADGGSRYFVEDTQGVRLADFHPPPGGSVHMVRPQARLYLRRTSDDREFDIPVEPAVVALDSLTGNAPRVASRGAAHEAFSLLFSLPFDADDVAAFSLKPEDAAPLSGDAQSAHVSSRTRAVVGWSAIGLGAASLATGVAFAIGARAAHDGGSPADSQAETANLNRRVRTYDTVAVAGLIGGAAALATGAVLLLWPAASVGGARSVRAAVLPDGSALLGYGGVF